MPDKIDELRDVRINKLVKLQQLGVDPYPVATVRSHPVVEAIKNFQQLVENETLVILAGRIRSIRIHGKLIFGNLEDETGSIQFLLRQDAVSEKIFQQFNLLDIGDIVQMSGILNLSKTGEKTLQLSDFTLLTKSIRPIPQEYFGLKDLETKLRKRYLDLLTNAETRELFRKKAIFWQTVRNFLIAEGFLEVWTPVLEHATGGADAEPFITHHNALDRDYFMRISLELPLKRLLVGGFEKVFEVGRLFRNEGVDRDHLQEYDDMEFYWAYADYQQGMALVETLYKKIIYNVTGGYLTEYEGHQINWGEPSSAWSQVDYFELFQQETGLDLNTVSDEELQMKAKELKLKFESTISRGRLIDQIYKKCVRPKLIQPVFLVGHPLETSPLAKKDPQNPKKILRFQPIAGGRELGNGFSELNDPLDQKARFQEQMKLKAAGDREAHMMDEDYVEALEYGMPPAVGFGMSERLFAVIMNRSIRETVIYPPMKEE